MGLGKTLEMISLILSNPKENINKLSKDFIIKHQNKKTKELSSIS